jgi:hypothetical protein
VTDEQKALRLQACQEFIQSVDDDRSLPDSIVTGDETRCFQYDPQAKRQSMEWRSPSSPRHKQFQKSKNKVMFVTFFVCQGIIHKECVPPGQTVNKEYYVEVLFRLVQRIRRVRPHFQERGCWFLLHHNARPYTAASIKQFLAKQGIPELNHPHILPIYPH